MTKILITGITGFAGSHLAELLVQQPNSEILGTHVSDRNLENIIGIKDKIRLEKVNLLDGEKIGEIVGAFKPDIIYHLAASTQPAESFRKPAEFLTNNIASEVNVLEAVKNNKLNTCKIVLISSAHVYGWVLPENIPMTESTPFRPDNPYSVSKIAQDYLGLSYYLAYKLHTIVLRPGNHIGPRQSPEISISRWAKEIVEIEKVHKEPILKVGNLTTKRDYTDVRDMVRAYTLAAAHGIAGEVYNIGTGVAYTMQDMLDKLLSYSSAKITVEVDQTFLRPSDIPELRIDASKFRQATGWKPELPIEITLQDTLNYWRTKIS
jgi:GDP-4-dehydro-6-deoxy-D-mannose reductase